MDTETPNRNPGTPNPGAINSETLHRMWDTRPVRTGGDRTVAGVCGGVAQRYRIDPTLVKVAFVVATLFGGSGIVLYIAAWVTFPSDGVSDGVSRRDQRDRFRAARGRRGRRRHVHGHDGRGPHLSPPVVVLVILVVAVTSFGPNVAWGSGGLLGAALMLLAWWLLYQRCPDPVAGTSADTVGAATLAATETFTRWTPRAWTDPSAAGTTASGPVDLTKERSATADTDSDTGPTTEMPSTPPAWDPLGVAPFAWDLPEPSDPAPTYPPATRRPRSALTPITLGVALLVAAAATTAAFAGVSALTPVRIMALSLAVVCVGLLVGVVSRRGSGLVGLAVILAVGVVGGSLLAGSDLLPGGGVGQREWRPLTEADIAAQYDHSVGQATLDLRSVTLTADRSVRVRGGVGEIRVIAPKGMNLDTRCRVIVGDQTCPSGDDGTAGPVLRVDISNVLGQVTVDRG
ncbi:PspC domain-containing protein [Williamsia herbipolensis]|uniref:PspC domain-containing protein n=1 Tax=Williamsia herbipolensis TaxID=1603258 RepID=UPI0009E28761|nr:PspC domain-containing protein [Williamsia herbipolensis]